MLEGERDTGATAHLSLQERSSAQASRSVDSPGPGSPLSRELSAPRSKRHMGGLEVRGPLTSERFQDPGTHLFGWEIERRV